MRLTKFNPETGQYEYKEPAKTQEEFIAQRKAVIQRLGEFEDRAEGEWVIIDSDLGYEELRCSNCNEITNRYLDEKPFAYCPNCGAEMKGENDEQR